MNWLIILFTLIVPLVIAMFVFIFSALIVGSRADDQVEKDIFDDKNKI